MVLPALQQRLPELGGPGLLLCSPPSGLPPSRRQQHRQPDEGRVHDGQLPREPPEQELRGLPPHLHHSWQRLTTSCETPDQPSHTECTAMIAWTLHEFSRVPRPPTARMCCRAFEMTVLRATCPQNLRMRNGLASIANVAECGSHAISRATRGGEVPHLCDVALLGAEPLCDVRRLAVGLRGSCSRRQHRLRLRPLRQEFRNRGKALPVLPFLDSYGSTSRAPRCDILCAHTFGTNTCCS